MLCAVFALAACGSNEEAEENNKISEEDNQAINEEEMEEVADLNTEPVEVEITEYGEEMGLILEAPATEVATVMPLQGKFTEIDDVKDDYAWVTIHKTDSIEELGNREIDYYLPLDGGSFAKEIPLPNGAGEYRVNVLLPSKDKEDYYYDSALFKITNVDETIAREVEYSKYGSEKDLQMDEDVTGYNEASESFSISGTVDPSYHEYTVLAEIKKDGQRNTYTIPVANGQFDGEIPLYYGEGTHEIIIQLYSDKEGDREGTYYDSASFYVHNDSEKELIKISQYQPYIDRGLALDEPSFATPTEWNEIEYPVKGTINPVAPLADTVSHVIVELQHKDNHKDKATYFFPVIDNKFDDVAHFRFGPGEYDVIIYVPVENQANEKQFQYTAALELKHEVSGVEDLRDILPSHGVDPNNQKIIEKAEQLTKDISDEREKTKAIYKFVASHVAYDVEKYKENVFHPDDNALETLETGKGICQDYAFLAIALLRSIDIESRYVQGWAGTDRHAWLEAKVDGDWIELDPTWGAGYIQDNEFTFNYTEDYFDPDPDFLKETHSRTGLMY